MWSWAVAVLSTPAPLDSYRHGWKPTFGWVLLSASHQDIVDQDTKRVREAEARIVIEPSG